MYWLVYLHLSTVCGLFDHMPESTKVATRKIDFMPFGYTKCIQVHRHLNVDLALVTHAGFKNSRGHGGFSQAVGHRISQCRKQLSCCLHFNLNNVTINAEGSHFTDY